MGAMDLIMGAQSGPPPMPDGTKWTAQTGLYDAMTLGGLSFTPLVGLCHNGTQYLAITQSGRVAMSTDGVTWNKITNLENQYPQQVFDVQWCGTRFVALSLNNIWTSQDGLTWAGINVTNNLTSTSYGKITPIGQDFLLVYSGEIFNEETQTSELGCIGYTCHNGTNVLNNFGITGATVIGQTTDGVNWFIFSYTTTSLKPTRRDIYSSVSRGHAAGCLWQARKIVFNINSKEFYYNPVRKEFVCHTGASLNTSTDGVTWVTGTSISNIANMFLSSCFTDRYMSVGCKYSDVISLCYTSKDNTPGLLWDASAQMPWVNKTGFPYAIVTLYAGGKVMVVTTTYLCCTTS